MPHGFNDPLPLGAVAGPPHTPAPLTQASGPVEPGETLNWIRVWVIQNVPAQGPQPQRAAAANGWSGANANLQNAWQVQTNMLTPQLFTPDKAALGIAIALAVNQHTNQQRIAWWADTINLS
jgi:hypothetical protein